MTPQEAIELRMKGEANNRDLACDICNGDGQRFIDGTCADCSGTGRNEASCLLIEGAHEIEKLRAVIEEQQEELEFLRWRGGNDGRAAKALREMYEEAQAKVEEQQREIERLSSPRCRVCEGKLYGRPSVCHECADAAWT